MRHLFHLFLFQLLILLSVRVYGSNYTVTNFSPYNISYRQGIHAGDTIFLDASRTRDVLFDRLTGEAGKPIVVINKGGICHISTGNINIRMERCRYMKVTGTGDKNHTYGIRLSNAVIQGMTIGLFCSDIEVDHVEITGSGFSGIAAKTDDYLSFAKTQEERNYVMKHLRLHHNYIHHLKGGEGFYIGHNAWPEDDKGKKQHDIDGIDIYKNTIEYTPREAIQVGACPSGNTRIHHNTIRYFGTTYRDSTQLVREKDDKQNNGIQMGQGFVGDCYNNWVENGPGKAMQLIGTGSANVFNNIIIEPGDWAFYIGSGRKRVQDSASINIFNNTIVHPGREAIKFDPQKATVHGNFYNNLIYNAKGIKDPGGKTGVFTDEKNLKAFNILENDSGKIKFIDLRKQNYRLSKGSIAIDKGYNTSESPLKFPLSFDYRDEEEKDIKGKTRRDQIPDIGAFEYHE